MYEIAQRENTLHPLSDTDVRFFDDIEAQGNFERALFSLATARMVCERLNKDAEIIQQISERYRSIRLALIEAVQTVHPRSDAIPAKHLVKLGARLNRYEYVYTTNYDLLPYWAGMEFTQGQAQEGNDRTFFKDFLWGQDQQFDPGNSHEFGREPDVTKMLFLHGALHLCHNVNGTTRKLTYHETRGDILSQFQNEPEWIPLFVSESGYKAKKQAIGQNDYLGFAYWKFKAHRGDLVILGHGLDEGVDKHILDAIGNWSPQRFVNGDWVNRMIAVSIFPQLSDHDIIATKTRILKALPKCHVSFFDSTTHPLGSDEVRVSVN